MEISRVGRRGLNVMIGAHSVVQNTPVTWSTHDADVITLQGRYGWVHIDMRRFSENIVSVKGDVHLPAGDGFGYFQATVGINNEGKGGTVLSAGMLAGTNIQVDLGFEKEEVVPKHPESTYAFVR